MQRYKKLLLSMLLLMTVITVAGCGFHLRGQTAPLPKELKTLYIDSGSPYGTLTLTLKQILRSLGTNIVKNPQDAPITLRIFHELFTSATFSESASTKTKQYIMHYTFDFQLQDNQQNIIYGPKSIATQQIYTVNEETVLSSNNEEAMVRNEIQHNAVYLLLAQLSADAVQQALATQHPHQAPVKPS